MTPSTADENRSSASIPSHPNDPRQLDLTLQRIAHSAQNFFAADACVIFAINPITRTHLAGFLALGQLHEETLELLKQTSVSELVQQALQGTLLFVEDSLTQPDILEPILSREEVRSFVILSLRTEQSLKPVAVIYLLYRQRRQFSSEVRQAIQAFAKAASDALQNTWLLTRYRVVARVGRDINQSLDTIEQLSKKLQASIADLIDSYYFLLIVHKTHSNTFDYYTFEDGAYILYPDQPVSGGARVAFTESHHLKIDHLSQTTDSLAEQLTKLPSDNPNDPESVIFLPLLFHDIPIGVLSVQHLKPNAYDLEDIHVLRLLSNHVALALSNIRLYQNTQHLKYAGEFLTQQLNADDDQLLHRVVDLIQTTTQADVVSLFPYIGGRFVLPPTVCGQLRHQDYVRLPHTRSDDIALLTLAQTSSVFCQDSAEMYAQLGGDLRLREGNFEHREGIRSTAAVPLRVDNEPIGVLFVNFRQTQRFDAPQRQLIDGLANYAAIAIRNARTFTGLAERRIEDLKTLRMIDREISKTLDLQQVLQTILESAVQRIPATHNASILLQNRRINWLETKAIWSRDKDFTQSLGIPLNVLAETTKGIVRYVFDHKEPVLVKDIPNDPRWRDIHISVTGRTRSELDVPLLDGDEIIGVINFESPEPSAFTEEDQDFLMPLAERALQAVKNAQTFAQVKAGEDQLEVLHEIDINIISQVDDPDQVMRFIVSNALRLVSADTADLYLFEDGRLNAAYCVRASASGGPAAVDLLVGDEVARLDRGIVQYVADTHQAYHTSGSAQDDPLYRGNTLIQSELAVPLLSGGELVGVLNLESREPLAFDKDSEKMLTRLAGQAVIGIKMARTYARAERERRRFRLLHQAGRELGTILDLDALDRGYESIIRIAHEQSQGQVIIRRYDPDTATLNQVGSVADYPIPSFNTMRLDEGLSGQVARERRTILVPDVAVMPEGVDIKAKTPSLERSVVGIPILFKQENKLYGTLILIHEEPNHFQDVDIELYEGLAQQLALAIQRVEIVWDKRQAEKRAFNAVVMSSIGQVAYELVHRLGNELGLVRSYTNDIRNELASLGVVSSVVETKLEQIVLDVGRVLKLNKDLKKHLAALRQEDDPQRYRDIIPVNVLLQELLQSALVQYAHESSIDVALEAGDDLGLVRAYRGRIYDILHNLVANAIEAMPNGGRIAIQAVNRGHFTEIRVADTGPGIPKELQERIFDLFFSTRGSSGFGLWSARINALVDGGDLTLESAPNQGATFILSLLHADNDNGSLR